MTRVPYCAVTGMTIAVVTIWKAVVTIAGTGAMVFIQWANAATPMRTYVGTEFSRRRCGSRLRFFFSTGLMQTLPAASADVICLNAVALDHGTTMCEAPEAGVVTDCHLAGRAEQLRPSNQTAVWESGGPSW